MRGGHFVANLRRFRLVTFDVTDTLLTFRQSPEVEYAEAIRRLGFPCSAACETRMSTQFRTHYKQLDAAAPNFGRGAHPQMTWVNWWRRLIEQVLKASDVHLSAGQMRSVADHLIDRYETADCWQTVPAANELITAVRDAGLCVGIISNHDPRLKFVVDNVRLPPFDFILASYEVGATKPSPLIFDLALKMCPRGAVLPHEALHVGNTPALDYVGARESGWCGALIANGKHDWQTGGQVKGAHVFESLAAFSQKLNDGIVDWDAEE